MDTPKNPTKHLTKRLHQTATPLPDPSEKEGIFEEWKRVWGDATWSLLVIAFASGACWIGGTVGAFLGVIGIIIFFNREPFVNGI